MTWRPKLLALDVDGTLVSFENKMTAAVKEVVWAAHDAGMHIVIATGRAVPGVYDVLDKLDMREGLAVASNGSVVFGVEPFEVIKTVTFDAGPSVAKLLDVFPEAMVAVEEVGVGYRVNRHFPTGEISGQILLEQIDKMVSNPVTRVIVRAPDHNVEGFQAAVRELGLEGTNFYIGYTSWVDMAPPGVSKASGLETVTSILGVDRADVLAIGDGNNDVEMLEWAGRGVAMGQAPDSVKDVADAVTGRIDEDGAVTEIQSWL